MCVHRLGSPDSRFSYFCIVLHNTFKFSSCFNTLIIFLLFRSVFSRIFLLFSDCFNTSAAFLDIFHVFNNFRILAFPYFLFATFMQLAIHCVVMPRVRFHPICTLLRHWGIMSGPSCNFVTDYSATETSSNLSSKYNC